MDFTAPREGPIVGLTIIVRNPPFRLQGDCVAFPSKTPHRLAKTEVFRIMSLCERKSGNILACQAGKLTAVPGDTNVMTKYTYFPTATQLDPQPVKRLD